MIRYCFAESNTGRSRVHILYSTGILADTAICNPMLKLELHNVFTGDVYAVMRERFCKTCMKKYLQENPK